MATWHPDFGESGKAPSETDNQVYVALVLDVVVCKCLAILQLLSSILQSLLIGCYTCLLVHQLLQVGHRVGLQVI